MSTTRKYKSIETKYLPTILFCNRSIVSQSAESRAQGVSTRFDNFKSNISDTPCSKF